MFCCTVSQGNSLASWKIMMHLEDGSPTGSPSNKISPELIDSKVVISFNKVLLPHPLAPTIATSSPFSLSDPRPPELQVSDRQYKTPCADHEFQEYFSFLPSSTVSAAAVACGAASFAVPDEHPNRGAAIQSDSPIANVFYVMFLLFLCFVAVQHQHYI